jgi:hypothetical protein
VGHVRGDAGIGQQVGEPTPAVGGLEHYLDRVRLELAEDAQQLRRRVGDPLRYHHLAGRVQGDDV